MMDSSRIHFRIYASLKEDLEEILPKYGFQSTSDFFRACAEQIAYWKPSTSIPSCSHKMYTQLANTNYETYCDIRINATLKDDLKARLPKYGFQSISDFFRACAEQLIYNNHKDEITSQILNTLCHTESYNLLPRISSLTGDQPFTLSSLRAHGIHGGIQHLVNNGHIICVKRRSQSHPAIYQISDRDIRRFRANQIYANPQTICDLLDGKISFRSLSRDTGYSVDSVKKHLYREIYDRFRRSEHHTYIFRTPENHQ